MTSCEELVHSQETLLKHQNSADQSWVVTITLSFASNRLCHGALLTLKWVATAAHCLKGKSAQNLKVVAAFETEESHLVSYFVLHPDYNDTFHHHNLALVKTTSSFTLRKGISPICPQSNQDSISCKGSCLVSFADQKPFGTSAMDLERCQTEYAKWGLGQWVTKSVNCLDDQSHTTQNCIGISGTPLTCLGNEDRRLLSGLLSLGWHCANPYSPAIFTKISDYYEWISNYIQGDEFGSLEECSQKGGGNYIESIRKDDEGLHIDVFIPKKDLAGPYKLNTISSTSLPDIRLNSVSPKKQPKTFITSKTPNFTIPIHTTSNLKVYPTKNATPNTVANLETSTKFSMTTRMIISTMKHSVGGVNTSLSPKIEFSSLPTVTQQSVISNKEAMANKIKLPTSIGQFSTTKNQGNSDYDPFSKSLRYSSTSKRPSYFILRSKSNNREVKIILNPDPKISLSKEDSFRINFQIKP